MKIRYDIKVSIANKNTGTCSSFPAKTLEAEVTADTDALLYDNHHIIAEDVYLFDIFKDEVETYSRVLGVPVTELEFDNFEVIALAPPEKYQVYFDFDSDNQKQNLRPTIKVYIAPKESMLSKPTLKGAALDKNSILWTWDDDDCAHYLVTEAIDPDNPDDANKIIAQLPIGVHEYLETPLDPGTSYTRRLISYTDTQYSEMSTACTIWTETASPDIILSQYETPRLYDFTIDESQREVIEERMKAFRSGVGDFTDLKVYKQMDADFYQKFKAYFEITGRRVQREKRYEQVGFWYKICLDAMERIDEQKGEVTFDVYAYPREWLRLEDYVWATEPVTIKASFECDVFIQQENAQEFTHTIKIYKAKEKTVEEITPGTTIPGTTYTDPPTFIGQPLYIMIIMDVTKSLISSNNVANLRDALVTFIDKLLDKKHEMETNLGTTLNVQMAVIGFGTNARPKYAWQNVENYASTFRGLSNSDFTDMYTSWDAGLKYASTYFGDAAVQAGGTKIAYFFTDGGANGYGASWTSDSSTGLHPKPTTTTKTKASADTLHGICTKVIPVVADYPWNSSGSWQDPTYSTQYSKANVHDLADYIAKGTSDGKAIYWRYNPDGSGSESLVGAFTGTISLLVVPGETHTTPPTTTPDIIHRHQEFDKWEEDPSTIQATSHYNIDTMRVEKVTSDEYTFIFDKTVTPVQYSRKERRAIIPASSFLEPTRMKDSSGREVNILQVIQEKVSLGPGEQFVKTSDGSILVRNLFIKDNYAIGDDDVSYTSGWEPGMNGSVNVFTDIDKGESDSYGDDCYLVNRNSYLKIQGFTDAIIYDGEHSVSAELNAYDYPQITAIHSNGSVVVDNNTDIQCNTFMFNRKDKARRYSGNGPYSHCVDVVECDRDIILRGLNNLITETPSPDSEDNSGPGQEIVKRSLQQYQVFDPMTTDISGLIELWYRSPVLNYRFNIEDPDAKTSIYEILPDCNPQDDYLHVVLLHVYYARNVYITDGPNPETLTGVPQSRFNYVSEYGDDPIAYYNDPNLLDDNPNAAEGLYKWTQKMWQNANRFDNGWYLDDFVWFQAEKMKEDIPYHDEIPGHGMQPMYGLVNGRYTSKSQDGKQDLLVQTPQFNVPTTVKDYYIHYGGSRNPINWNGDGTHPLKIYIVLTEFHPRDALVGYKWEKDCQWVNPETGKVNDDITQDYKGCYATFSCDSVTFKDVEYYDLVQTINFENQEVFDTKNNIIHYQLEKPNTEYTYTNYYLKVSTDNSDVLPLNYPGEIMFDEDGHADFGVTFKGVVNATTKWSPRIHNGYYYLNQHEYFAYSEFDFDRQKTKIEHHDLERCIEVFGHMTFDVTLCHKAAPPEIYRGNNAIVKNNRSSLLQNENQFQWVDGKGVTLKPSIDGEYYKEYTTYMYYSPVLSFPNTLTVHGPVYLDYFIEDGTKELMGVEIRSYVLEDGQWSDWYPLAGVEIPCYPNTGYAIPADVPLSHAYQLRFYLQASVKHRIKELEDYLCCYLDWKDDGEESACYNIVTITDHITTGPYHGNGVFASKIFDYGCDTGVYFDIFASNRKNKVKLYVASSIEKNNLYMENAAWQDFSNGGTISGRYVRYKIEIPEGEKLYWLHKKVVTYETEAVLPYVCGFTMEGEYHPSDVITNFINTEAFEILADGTYHNLDDFADLTKIIGDDVLDRGYKMDEIKKVDVRCTTSNVHVLYNSNLLNEYPGAALKNTQLRAMAPLQTVTDINYTPYIFLDDDDMGYDKITVYGATPQQYCPITVEDPEGQSYIQLHECTDFEQRMKIVCKEKTKYIELPTNRYDYLTMRLKVNDAFIDDSQYRIVNHIIIFNDFLEIGDSVEVIYSTMYSFIAEVNRYGDEASPANTVIYLYTGHRLDENGEVQYILASEKYKIFFETGLRNNKFTANELSLNPIYRTDYKGFIYLTDDNNEPYTVKIYCNPRRIKAGGYDKVDIAVEVLDMLGNPVINREVYIDCGSSEDDENSFDRGIINCDNNMTDMNGVVHFVYESSVLPVEATIRASVFNCAGASIEDSITIVNE